MRITQVRAIIVIAVLAVVAAVTSWMAIVNDSQTAEARHVLPARYRSTSSWPKKKTSRFSFSTPPITRGLPTRQPLS